MMKRTQEHEGVDRIFPITVSWLVILLASGCAAPSQNQTLENPVALVEIKEKVKKVKTTEVLFIGNSYSFGVPKAFKQLARQNGEKVRVGNATHGGWTLEQHLEHEPTLEKLRSRDWDVVVIQEQSQRPARKESQRHAVMDPAVQFFVNQARAIGATPMLYQTWGRRDGLDWVKGDDFLQMNSRIREGYRSASDQAGGVTVVPAGDAWEREFLAGRGNELFEDDGSHPSEFGDKVTAEVFYDTIFSNSSRVPE